MCKCSHKSFKYVSLQLTDLAFFLVILIIVILAYGVASQTLRFPNDTVEWKLLKDVVYLPYWQMYGELMLDRVEGSCLSRHLFPDTSRRCVVLMARAAENRTTGRCQWTTLSPQPRCLGILPSQLHCLRGSPQCTAYCVTLILHTDVLVFGQHRLYARGTFGVMCV